MPNQEHPLTGGNVSGVVRIGGCVHRRMDSWSSAVHELLRHLESQEFDGAPRFLGRDAQDREMLTFIEGEVGNDPLRDYMRSNEVLEEMGRLLRRYHDATADFVQRSRRKDWQIIFPDESRHEVICHNDAAPYNTVFVDEKPVALIDFDTAGPGPRIWDIAYALYTFIPLSRFVPSHNGELVPYDSQKHMKERRSRIRLFCDAYGLEHREQLPETVGLRLMALCALISQKAEEGAVAFQKMIEEGHLDHYREEINFHNKYFHEYFGD